MSKLKLYETFISNTEAYEIVPVSLVSNAKLKLISDIDALDTLGQEHMILLTASNCLVTGIQIRKSSYKGSAWTQKLLMPFITHKKYFTLVLTGNDDPGEPFLEITAYNNIEEANKYAADSERFADHSNPPLVGEFKDGLVLWYGQNTGPDPRWKNQTLGWSLFSGTYEEFENNVKDQVEEDEENDLMESTNLSDWTKELLGLRNYYYLTVKTPFSKHMERVNLVKEFVLNRLTEMGIKYIIIKDDINGIILEFPLKFDPQFLDSEDFASVDDTDKDWLIEIWDIVFYYDIWYNPANGNMICRDHSVNVHNYCGVRKDGNMVLYR